MRVALLLHPDLHDEPVRQELDEQHLAADAVAEDGEVLALFVVLEGFFDHVGGLPEDVVVGDGAVVGDGVLEELGLDPAGRDGHDADAPRLQLDVQRPGEAQDEGLGRAVDALVRHGLEGRERVEVYDAAAALHIGQAELRHGDEGLVVYVYHGEVNVQRRLGEEGEAPEARDVAERGDEGLFLFQQLFVLLKAGRVAEVHGQDARGRAQLFCQAVLPFDQYDFTKYKEMHCKKERAMYKPNIKNIDPSLKQNGLLFTDPEVIRKFETFRNEYVYNGPWDLRSSVYYTAVNGEPADVIIYSPDMVDGHFVTSNSRNKFYSQNNRINEQLPDMIKEATQILMKTIDQISALYQQNTVRSENPKLTEEYMKAIADYYKSLI